MNHFSRVPLRTFGGFLLCAVAAYAESTSATVPVSTVPALVADVAAHNPELKFYEAEIAAAQAGRRGATASNDPELSLSVGRKRVRDAAGTLAGEGTAWSVAVTQTFEWPGRLDLRKAIANQQVALAELGLARFKGALAARTRTLAYGLAAAHAKATAVREVADRFAALKETFLARDPAGITPLLETRIIEASELAIQRRASDAELAVQTALLELNQLRGAAVDAPLRVATPELVLQDPPARDALLAAARDNNFEFKMRRVELEQQGLTVRLAQHERRPAVSVGPFVSREGADERETVVGLNLSVPLPVGGRTRSTAEGAEARRRQAETAVIVAQRELERDVLTTAHVLAVKAAEFRRWPAAAMKKFAEAAELADRHYRLGAVPVATYVELQNAYLEALEAMLDTQREALEAGLKLQQLTGLDFEFARPSETTPGESK